MKHLDHIPPAVEHNGVLFLLLKMFLHGWSMFMSLKALSPFVKVNHQNLLETGSEGWTANKR